MKAIGLYLLLAIVSLSCSMSEKKNQAENAGEDTHFNTEVEYPVTVRLLEAINRADTSIKLSTFVESVTYIPLKLTEDYYLKFFQLHAYDEQEKVFFIGDLYNLLSADSTGALLSKIGRRGQGPGEYPQIGTVSVDTKNKAVYVKVVFTDAMQKFDYKGKFIKKMFTIPGEEVFTSNVFYDHENFVAVGETYSFHHVNNIHRFYGFGVMDTTGRWLERTPPQAAQISLIEGERLVQLMDFSFRTVRSNNHILLLHSGLADTVFTVENNHVVPRYYLDYGNEKPELKDIWQHGKEREAAIRKSIFIMNPAYETKRYFFIKLYRKGKEYIVCHDKYKNITRSVQYDYNGFSEELRKDMDPVIPIRNFGFVNDLDGGIDAYPVIESSDGNYWIGYVDATMMKAILTDDYFKERPCSDKEKQAQLKKLVASLEEEDHQVLMLMKLKEEVK